MRKWISVLVSVVFLFLPLQYSNAANPKAGATCSKLNAKQIYTGKVFTCIQSGKKLLWDKGVTVNKQVSTSPSKSTPAPTANPNSNSNSSAPTPTPNPSPSKFTPKVDSVAPLLETPCTNAGEEKIANYLLVCYKDRTRGLIWIRKGNEFVYKLLGQPTSMINNSDIGSPKTSITYKQYPNPLITLPNITTNQIGPTDINQCKLKDLHDKKNSPDGPMAHGFPVEPMNPKYVKEGILKIGILPVDFIDAPGESSLKEDLKTNISIMEDWFNYYSGGKVKLQITTSDNWIHTNKMSAAFDWKSSYPNIKWLDMAQKIGQSYIDLAPSNFDFSQIGALLIYMPQKDNSINVDLTLQSLEYSTKQGNQFVAVEAPPVLLYKRGQVSWAFWVHELLHGIGIAGHAPGGEEGMPVGIMENQFGGSFGLTAWEQFILGWLPDSQVYCIAPEQATGQIVGISPMDREDSFTKSIVIPLSDHSGLVVQSNRNDKWSSKQYRYNYPDNYSGVMVYLVDTKNGNYRSKGFGVDTPEFSGVIPSDVAPEELYYANFVRIDGEPTREFGCPAGLVTQPGQENSIGMGCWQWNVMKYVVGAVGDTFTFGGVKIQVVGSSKLDYVSITKNP